MPKYSSGPFMHMSPAGAPGLLVVLVVTFGVASLFVPRAYHPALSVPFFIAIVVVFVLAIRAQFRGAPDVASPTSLLGLPAAPADLPVSGSPETAEAPSARRQPYVTAALALIAATTVTYFFLRAIFPDVVGEVPEIWLTFAFAVIVLTALVTLVVASVARRMRPKPPGAA